MWLVSNVTQINIRRIFIAGSGDSNLVPVRGILTTVTFFYLLICPKSQPVGFRVGNEYAKMNNGRSFISEGGMCLM